MRESHDKAVNLSSDSRHKSSALPDAERKITHTRRANISWMHPSSTKGISVHEQPVEENVDVACHHNAIVAVLPLTSQANRRRADSGESSLLRESQVCPEADKSCREATPQPRLNARRLYYCLSERVGKKAIDDEDRKGHSHENAAKDKQLR